MYFAIILITISQFIYYIVRARFTALHLQYVVAVAAVVSVADVVAVVAVADVVTVSPGTCAYLPRKLFYIIYKTHCLCRVR